MLHLDHAETSCRFEPPLHQTLPWAIGGNPATVVAPPTPARSPWATP